MTEELEVLTIVAGRLEAAGIAYMVTGSFAANYYAVPRMTRDIDLVVELSAGDTDRFCALFEGDFYLDQAAVRAAIASRGAFNLIHLAHVVKVDCIVRKDSEYRRTEFARQRRARGSDHLQARLDARDALGSPARRRAQPSEVDARPRQALSGALVQAPRARRALSGGAG